MFNVYCDLGCTCARFFKLILVIVFYVFGDFLCVFYVFLLFFLTWWNLFYFHVQYFQVMVSILLIWNESKQLYQPWIWIRLYILKVSQSWLQQQNQLSDIHTVAFRWYITCFSENKEVTVTLRIHISFIEALLNCCPCCTSGVS